MTSLHYSSRHVPATLSPGLAVLAVALVYLCLHGALFAFDLTRPDAMLEGDRAAVRIARIAAFTSAPDRWSMVYQSGPPGDYIVQALFSLAGGRPAIVAMQILAGFAVVLGAMGLARALGGDGPALLATGALATFAPGMILNPHVLASECLTTFAFMLAVLCCAEAMRRPRAFLCVLGFALLAAVSFFRPGNLVLPLAAAAALTALGKLNVRVAFGCAAMSYLLYPGIWLALRYMATGEFGLGASDFDLPTNFWDRAVRIAQPGDAFDAYSHVRKLPLQPFLLTLLSHPAITLKTYVSDIANLLVNPGSNLLFGRYLHLTSFPDDIFFFHNVIDRQGLTGLIAQIPQFGLTYTLLFAVMTAVNLGVLAAVLSLPFLLRRRGPLTESGRIAVFVLIMAATVLVFSLVAGNVRWTHRSAVEPLFAALAVYALRRAVAPVRS